MMAQPSPGILDQPAKKMFIKMLAEEDITATLGNTDLVWLEGIIREVRGDASTFVLDDATATTRVDYSNPKKLSSYKDDLVRVNSSVMVVGRIERYPPNSLITALRISPIPNFEVNACMWEMEVVDQHREVYRARYRKRLREEGDPMAHYPMGY